MKKYFIFLIVIQILVVVIFSTLFIQQKKEIADIKARSEEIAEEVYFTNDLLIKTFYAFVNDSTPVAKDKINDAMMEKYGPCYGIPDGQCEE